MIVRGYVIPKRDGEKFLYSRVISRSESQQIFEDFDGIFKLVLKDFTVKNKKIRTAKDMNRFLDALILFFRSILYRDTLPGVIPATISYVYHFFLDKCLLEERWNYSPKDYYNELANSFKCDEMRRRGEELERIRSKLPLLLDFPADSRPGANTSSLIIHTLTTTSIASALYLNDEEANRIRDRNFDLAVLRLTCFFHDIGKLIDWRRHEEEASKYVLSLLSGYVEGEGLEVVKLASRLIRREERGLGFERLRKFYVEADRKASEIDRLSKYLLRLLEPEQAELLLNRAGEYLEGKVSEEEFEKCYREFDYWRRFTLEEQVKITEAFCKQASVMLKDNPLFEFGRVVSPQKSEVKVVRYDIRGVQSYIRVNDLRSMAGASLLVDYTIFVGIPLILNGECQIPAEAILYFGGGNITVILPASREKEISEKIVKNVKELVNLSVLRGSAFLGESFFQMNREIDEELARMKLKGYDEPAIHPIYLNMFMKCEFCGHECAEKIEKEGERTCSSCSRKREVGDNFHFLYKLNRLGYAEQLYPNYLVRMMEYISGSPREEVESESIKKYKNLAILRFDASNAGLLMASSISITDAFERSVRIDSSLKEAYQKFLNILQTISQDYYDRMVLGTIYMGGDDGFLLAPSKIAVHLAIAIMNDFYLEIGGKLSLSVGIAVAKPKHPLIPLYETAGFILDDIVKEGTRRLAYQECAPKISEPSLNFRGALGFYTADGGFMSGESLKTVIEELYREGISGQKEQPYLLCNAAPLNREKSIFTLLNILEIPGMKIGDDISNLFETIRKSMEWLLKDENSIEHVKKTQRIINDVLKVDVRGDYSPKIQSLYIGRQVERLEEERGVVEGLLNLLDMKNGEVRLHIYDLLLLIKVIIGE